MTVDRPDWSLSQNGFSLVTCERLTGKSIDDSNRAPNSTHRIMVSNISVDVPQGSLKECSISFNPFRERWCDKEDNILKEAMTDRVKLKKSTDNLFLGLITSS